MTGAFDPSTFAERQLYAYDARELERFASEHTDDVQFFKLHTMPHRTAP